MDYNSLIEALANNTLTPSKRPPNQYQINQSTLSQIDSSLQKNPSRTGQPGIHCRYKSREAMPVAQLTLEIRIEHAQSLKDRRQVVRSLKDQLKQSFNISVAELDEAVTWQSATIGVVAVSRSRDYLHGLIDEVERAARRMTNELGAELADSYWEYIET